MNTLLAMLSNEARGLVFLVALVAWLLYFAWTDRGGNGGLHP